MSVLSRMVLLSGMALCILSTTAITPVLAQQASANRDEFPGRRVGGGTRGDCLKGDQRLVAFSPVNNLGVTASDRPSLYFAVPKVNEAYAVEFVLRDANGNSVYKTALEAGKNKEMVGVHLPKNTLAVKQDYQWYFSVVCDADDRSQNLVLSGWLRRVSPDVAFKEVSGLESSLQLAQSYQQAGLWSDAIATLVEVRQNYPQNDQVRLQWQQLLQQLELKSVFEPSVVGQL